jgi:hypothetical protein
LEQKIGRDRDLEVDTDRAVGNLGQVDRALVSTEAQTVSTVTAVRNQMALWGWRSTGW